MQTSLGLRRIDRLIQTPAGDIVAIEVKSGNATRSATQVAKDTEIATLSGKPVGKNAPKAFRGRTMKIDTIERTF